MNTNRLFLLIFSLYLSFSNAALAQNSYLAGGLPSVNFNYKLKKAWSVNFKLESRQLLKAGVFTDNSDINYEYVLTDYSFIAAKKIGLNSKISGGYLIRFRNGEVIHRLIQQYTITQKLSRFRLSHRLVTDQTISPVEATEYRLRYRLASEIPLNGESVDPQECYLKISNEYLNSLKNRDYDLEVRLVPMFGYIINEHHKIELGLDYRVKSFLDQNTRHSFWTCLNWYIEI